jgi:hypothetical protein
VSRTARWGYRQTFLSQSGFRGPPGGFPPSRKPKKSGQNRQPRPASLAARLPVASLIRAGVVITGAAIVVLVIAVIAVGQH